MRALVTGGAGFIGHRLVHALVERGDEVVVLDDFSTGMRSRLEPHASLVRVIEGSILEADALDEAAAGCDVVFHEAALASVEQSFLDPIRTNDVNVTGTIQVLLAAARQRVRRVVFASSSAVYGIPDALPCRETARPVPLSPYGASKLAAEGYLHTLGAQFGVESTALRYFNVYGPGQDRRSDYAAVIPLFISSVLEGRRPLINGDGRITRDFIFVDDVVSANLMAADAPKASGLSLNIASGVRTSLLELLHAIAAATGTDVAPAYGPPRVGDVRDSQADVSLAASVIGHTCAVPFVEGIERTVTWYRANMTVHV